MWMDQKGIKTQGTMDDAQDPKPWIFAENLLDIVAAIMHVACFAFCILHFAFCIWKRRNDVCRKSGQAHQGDQTVTDNPSRPSAEPKLAFRVASF
jgi:hypothetical protein